MTEIEIELPEEQLLYLCLEAHKHDLTINQYVNNILKEYIENIK